MGKLILVGLPLPGGGTRSWTLHGHRSPRSCRQGESAVVYLIRNTMKMHAFPYSVLATTNFWSTQSKTVRKLWRVQYRIKEERKTKNAGHQLTCHLSPVPDSSTPISPTAGLDQGPIWPYGAKRNLWTITKDLSWPISRPALHRPHYFKKDRSNWLDQFKNIHAQGQLKLKWWNRKRLPLSHDWSPSTLQIHPIILVLYPMWKYFRVWVLHRTIQNMNITFFDLLTMWDAP